MNFPKNISEKDKKKILKSLNDTAKDKPIHAIKCEFCKNICEYMKQERERGITITSAATCEWNNLCITKRKINSSKNYKIEVVFILSNPTS